MKNILLIIIIALLCSCSNDYASSHNIKGNPKKINLATYVGSKVERYSTLVEFKVISFDESGSITNMETRDKKGNVETVSRYLYSDDGTLQSIELFDSDNREVNREVATDWANGLISNSTIDYPDFTEDYFGNVKAYNNYSYFTMVYERNMSGQISQSKRIGGKGFEEITIMSYNENSDLLTEKSKKLKQNGEIEEGLISYEYQQFDENSNWSQRLKHIDGEKTHIQTQKIVYYD